MILRVCVVVPTFNNPRTISSVVKDIVKKTKFPVLIIDDGSETPVTNVLYSYEVREALEEGRVRVLRFEENRGKGIALQFAIEKLISEGFTHMFSVDGDGQHLAAEIPKLVELAKRHPWDLIIGNRRLKSKTVPQISKFGRKFSNFWVAYQTGLQIHDSQSGFRLYPLFPLQTMKFRTKKYDFEIEVLIRLMWRGVQVREVDIDVLYPEGEERVSHFHKFWDNARISLLNTALVVISMLRSHRDPVPMSLAVGIGVFIGCTPFFGFHTLIVAAAALGLRLNVVAAWLGSQISLPPFVPLLVLASVFIGKNILGIPETGGIVAHFNQWIVGSFVLGAILGLAAGFATYAAMVLSKRQGKKSNWSGKSRGGVLGTGFLKLVINRFGLQTGYFFLNFIIPYFWAFAPNARRGINEYYSLLHPEWTWWQRQKAVMKHFFKFGQILMDRVHQGYRGGQQFQTNADGMHHILDASRAGHGLVMLGAHLGGWDLSAALLGTHGFDDHMHMIEYQPAGLSFKKVKDKMDPKYLKTVNSRMGEDATFEIHQALKRGECIGLMGDRPIGDRFELIPFLGRLAPFDVTAYRLAAALRVPLLLTFGFKNGTTYDFYARPPREYHFQPGRSRDEQLYQWASLYVREIEYFVKRYPDQWFNFYPFWSALPAAPNGQLAAQANNNLLQELNERPVRVPERAPAPTPNDAKL